jgi:hypothetical protein
MLKCSRACLLRLQRKHFWVILQSFYVFRRHCDVSFRMSGLHFCRWFHSLTIPICENHLRVGLLCRYRCNWEATCVLYRQSYRGSSGSRFFSASTEDPNYVAETSHEGSFKGSKGPKQRWSGLFGNSKVLRCLPITGWKYAPSGNRVTDSLLKVHFENLCIFLYWLWHLACCVLGYKNGEPCGAAQLL